MDPKIQNTALLVMDMQTSILQRLPDPSIFIANVGKAITYARSLDIPVLFIIVGFRQGAPELNMNNKGNTLSRESLINANMEEWMKIEPAISPNPGEIVIIKRRISAFTGSDLEVVLRAFGIQHMVLSGITTSGVVLSTVREAADKDFRLTVLSDCCADPDQEVHRVLTTKIFPRQAGVFALEEWINQ